MPPGGEQLLPWVDVVIMAMTLLAAAYMGARCQWVPGWQRSFQVFFVLALGPAVLRPLVWRFPESGLLRFVAAYWLLGAVGIGHTAMGPLVDALHAHLYDPQLASWDVRIFGALPSSFLDRHLGRALTEFSMVSYYTYFFWPPLLGLFLYFGRRRRPYQHYVFALSLGYALNFMCYVCVPAVGPRFFFGSLFASPVQGLWLTSWLDGGMRMAPFMRDCFPSGHTATTLVVLSFAYRYLRRFFWIMLLPAMGLVLGTLAGRFHYGIDVICAVPLALFAVLGADAVMRRWPDGPLPSRPCPP